MRDSKSCKHLCECGKEWSCREEFNSETCTLSSLWIASGKAVHTVHKRFDFYSGEKTFSCPWCFEEKHRWYSKEQNGRIHLRKLSFKAMIQKMEEDRNRGKLSGAEISEISAKEEAMCKDMSLEELERHYQDVLEKLERWKVIALTVRKLKTEKEIEEQSKVFQCLSKEEFEESKRRSQYQAAKQAVAAVRKSKAEKLIEDWAARIMKSNPKLSREEALERAKKMIAD